MIHTVGSIDLIAFKESRVAVQGHPCKLVSQQALEDFDVGP